MRRNRVLPAACFVLTLLLAAGAGFVGPARGAVFSDIKGHWAEGSMLEMSKYGIVSGYPDGTFKPGRSVSRLELVAMILNAAGERERAEAIDPARTGLTFPAGVTWGKGHLALAVEKGMITAEGLPGFNPNREATRLEMAALLSLALDLTIDYTPLTFQDVAKISPGYQPYVSTVVKYGLIVGMPGNQFMPDLPVTRAQVSAMLLRAIEAGLAHPCKDHSSFGRLTETIGGDGGFTIRNISGIKNLKVAADYVVIREEKIIEASGLSKGDRVKAIVNSSGRAVLIKVLKDDLSTAQTVKGLITATSSTEGVFRLSIEKDGRSEAYPVYQDARIYRDGKEDTVAALARDNYVEAELDARGNVWRVTVYEAKKVTGTIVGISSGEITVRSMGDEREYDVDRLVKVTRNIIREMSYSELKRGNRVELVVLGSTVYHIDFLSDSTASLRGIFSRLRADTFYVYTDEGEKGYKLDRYAEVIRDGRVIDISRINRGELVAYELDGHGRLVYVEVLDEKNMDIEGEVSYVTSNSIGIIDDGGLDYHYDVSSSVKVLRYGDLINLPDIVPGAKVAIVLEKGKVTEIEVVDDENITITGFVVNINQERGRITLEISRLRHTYDLGANPVVTDVRGKTIRLTDVNEQNVKARLVNGRVAEISLTR